MTAGQAGFFRALSTPEDPRDQIVSPSNFSSQTYSSSEGSIQPPSMIEYDGDSSDGNEDLDAEGIMVRVGLTLALDRNVANFRWIIRVVFEPLKLVERMEYLLNKRYASDDLRYATTLVADIAYWLVNNPTSGEGFLALSRLQARVDHKIALFNANKEVPPEICGHEALSTLLYEIEEPMLFRYDVTPLSEPFELDSHSPGIQWMHGIPDQFLIMLARMNMLREDSAPNIDPNTISDLEAQISSFEPAFDRSTDSYLAIARLTVQETWRQAMYIYLYMGLCGANSRDQRVEKALKTFMRVLEGVAPRLTSDAFLIVPMIMAGVAARKKQNRVTIQRRM
ncbi:hypothetical protein FRC09_014174, partial [Ceratobasidium sp. 395]